MHQLCRACVFAKRIAARHTQIGQPLVLKQQKQESLTCFIRFYLTVINVCEMKFSINEYVIDKDYDMVLRNKLDAFRRMTNCKKSLQTTMITTYGVKRGKYSGIINSQITLEDLFQ